MAMKTDEKPATSEAASSRRLTIGASVAIAVVAATLLLILVNAISYLKHMRKDIATLGSYGLSERTRSTLDERTGELSIWMLYTPEEDNERQTEYIDRLQEYLDELRSYDPEVSITHVTSDSQREKLAEQLSAALGSEADQHKSALETFEQTLHDLDSTLAARFDQAQRLISGDSWLGDFPLFAEVARILRNRQSELAKAKEEVDELIPEGGIPKYADACNRAKTALTNAKQDLEGIADFLDKLNTLADEVAKPDSANVRVMREVAAETSSLIRSLRETVGENDAPQPADAAAVLKAYIDRGTQVKNSLESLVLRVDAFGRKFPMVKQHPNWRVDVRRGPIQTRMAVAGVMEMAGESLAESRLHILGVIDTGNPDELAQETVKARASVSNLEQNAEICGKLLGGLADRLSNMDDGSRALLEECRGGELFKDLVASVTQLEKTFDELPTLELGSVADQLKEKNVVVVKVGSAVRVLTFAEVFPIRQSVAGPASNSEDELGRAFNGDSAISSALLALLRERPFATVVLVSFEPPGPPQQGPFSTPPPQSRVPSSQLSDLRKRLDQANFKVVDWNLATTEEAPEPEEGTENVYVLLPPAVPGPANPFDRNPQPPKTMGDTERRKIQDILNNDGRALFVATWEFQPGGMFGGAFSTPEYRYGPILEADWGIQVHNESRVVWLKPEPSRADSFKVVGPRFAYLPASGFSEDHPLSKPSRGTRFMVNDACPITLSDKAPEGVKREAVQTLYESEELVGTDIQDLLQIVDEIRQPRNEGIVTLGPNLDHGPFDLMVVAERHQGEESKGRIAVMGFGGSLVDSYITQPVIQPGETIRFDPPPTECVDLFVNTLHWLQGQTDWIARGPAPKPTIRQIPKNQMASLQVLVWAVWPVVVFLPGVFFWYVRRK